MVVIMEERIPLAIPFNQAVVEVRTPHAEYPGRQNR
jgi:hypothetical protein